MFHSISPTSHRSSYFILGGTVGIMYRTFLGTMRHILPIRNSYLLAKHTLALGTMVSVRLFLGSIVGSKDTGTCLLLPRNPDGIIYIRCICHSRIGDLLDLGCRPFTFVFNLNCGQDITPIFMVQGAKVLLMVLQLVLHE